MQPDGVDPPASRLRPALQHQPLPPFALLPIALPPTTSRLVPPSSKTANGFEGWGTFANPGPPLPYPPPPPPTASPHPAPLSPPAFAGQTAPSLRHPAPSSPTYPQVIRPTFAASFASHILPHVPQPVLPPASSVLDTSNSAPFGTAPPAPAPSESCTTLLEKVLSAAGLSPPAPRGDGQHNPLSSISSACSVPPAISNEALTDKERRLVEEKDRLHEQVIACLVSPDSP